MSCKELSDRYDEKRAEAEPAKELQRKWEVERKARAKTRRNELIDLQIEMQPLFSFLKIVKRWLSNYGSASLTVPLNRPDHVLEIYLPSYEDITLEVKYIPPEPKYRSSAQLKAELALSRARVRGLYHGQNHSSTVAEFRKDVENLRVLRDINFDAFMDALIDFAVKNDWNYKRLMRTANLLRNGYVRKNCH